MPSDGAADSTAAPDADALGHLEAAHEELQAAREAIASTSKDGLSLQDRLRLTSRERMVGEALATTDAALAVERGETDAIREALEAASPEDLRTDGGLESGGSENPTCPVCGVPFDEKQQYGSGGTTQTTGFARVCHLIDELDARTLTVYCHRRIPLQITTTRQETPDKENTASGQEPVPDGGEPSSHAERNATMLRELDRAKSRALVRTHNGLVDAVETACGEFNGRVLDDGQVETVADSLGQLEAVAKSIRDDDRVLDDRLLASAPEVTLRG